jgi:hypothetical protein
MRLRLSELREVAKKTIDDRKISDELIREIRRVFGARVEVGSDVNTVTECANYILDSMEQRGEGLQDTLSTQVLRAARKHHDPEVRKLSARLLPMIEAKLLVNDEDSSVRHAVARRMPASEVLEALRLHGDDDELNVIYRSKKIAEATDKFGPKFTGDSTKQQDYIELSEGFYDILARQFINDYGMTWQQNWPLAVKRYVSSVRATSGVDVDSDKLYEAIKSLYEEREDEIIEDNTSKQIHETLNYLATQMEDLDESVDVVEELLHSNLGATDFIERVYDVYGIKESYLPPAIKKHCLGENEGVISLIPQRASTPHKNAVNECDEKVLDKFVEAWNKRQALAAEPLKLEWYINPMDAASVGFSIKLM